MTIDNWSAPASATLTQSDLNTLKILQNGNDETIKNFILRSTDKTPIWAFNYIVEKGTWQQHTTLISKTFNAQFLFSPKFQTILLNIARKKNAVVILSLADSNSLVEESMLTLVDIALEVGGKWTDSDKEQALGGIASRAKYRSVVETIYRSSNDEFTLSQVVKNPLTPPAILGKLIKSGEVNVRLQAAYNDGLDIVDLVDAVSEKPAFYTLVLDIIFDHVNRYEFLKEILTRWGVLKEDIDIPVEVMMAYVREGCTEAAEQFLKERFQ